MERYEQTAFIGICIGICVGIFFGMIIFGIGIATTAIYDGEITLVGQRFIRVDAEENRWLEEGLCCSSNSPDASCPKGMLHCSIISNTEQEVCKKDLADCREGFEDMANLYIDEVLIPKIEKRRNS